MESLFALKMALGMHSANRIMNIHENTISTKSLKEVIHDLASLSILLHTTWFSRVVISKTTTTREKLNPTTLVPINREGLSNKLDNRIPLWLPCFFFSSIFSRLAEEKATSIPEK